MSSIAFVRSVGRHFLKGKTRKGIDLVGYTGTDLGAGCDARPSDADKTSLDSSSSDGVEDYRHSVTSLIREVSRFSELVKKLRTHFVDSAIIQSSSSTSCGLAVQHSSNDSSSATTYPYEERNIDEAIASARPKGLVSESARKSTSSTSLQVLLADGELDQNASEADLNAVPNIEFIRSLLDVISCVAKLLTDHPSLHADELAPTVRALYEQCIEHQRLSAGEPPDFTDIIDALVSAFIVSISVYALDSCNSGSVPEDLDQLRLSLEALLVVSSGPELAVDSNHDLLDSSSDALEEIESRHQVCDYICHVSRQWSRYTKELHVYAEKRAQIEAEFASKLLKLSRSTKENLFELDLLPCQLSIEQAIDQDIRFCRHCIETHNVELVSNIVEPLHAQWEEYDQLRRDVHGSWQRDCKKAEKKLTEAVVTLKKSEQRYDQYYTDLKKFDLPQAAGGIPDKSGKLRTYEEVKRRVSFCEAQYKNCVDEANSAQRVVNELHEQGLDKMKSVLSSADQRLKSLLETFCKAESSLWALSLGMGSQLSESLSDGALASPLLPFLACSEMMEPYAFETYPDRMTTRNGHVRRPVNPEISDLGLSEQRSPVAAWSDGDTATARTRARAFLKKQWSSVDADLSLSGANLATITSPTDSHLSDRPPRVGRSVDGSDATMIMAKSPCSPSKSLEAEDSSSTPSFVDLSKGTPRRISTNVNPLVKSARGRSRSAAESLKMLVGKDAKIRSVLSPCRAAALSEPAQTHSFRRLHGSAKCRHCETYVYFSGVDCSVCGLACHRRCLRNLQTSCGSKQNGQLSRTLSTFGIDIARLMNDSLETVPRIVESCIEAVDERGLRVQGIYRVSGVKSKVEQLCQRFESQSGEVNLSHYSPHHIASVLKLFFRQLPVPLLTFELYSDLIAVGREGFVCKSSSASPDQQLLHEQTVERLRNTLTRLPGMNFYTCRLLMRHLARVSELAHINNMHAGNLGIVFGPTLMANKRKLGEHVSSAKSLVDMPHQVRAIEFLIELCSEVFTDDLEPIKNEVEQAEVLDPAAIAAEDAANEEEKLQCSESRNDIVKEMTMMCALLENVTKQNNIHLAVMHTGSLPRPRTVSVYSNTTTTSSLSSLSVDLPGGISDGAEVGTSPKSVMDDADDLLVDAKRRQEQRQMAATHERPSPVAECRSKLSVMESPTNSQTWAMRTEPGCAAVGLDKRINSRLSQQICSMEEMRQTSVGMDTVNSDGAVVGVAVHTRQLREHTPARSLFQQAADRVHSGQNEDATELMNNEGLVMNVAVAHEPEVHTLVGGSHQEVADHEENQQTSGGTDLTDSEAPVIGTVFLHDNSQCPPTAGVRQEETDFSERNASISPSSMEDKEACGDSTPSLNSMSVLDSDGDSTSSCSLASLEDSLEVLKLLGETAANSEGSERVLAAK